MLRRLFIKLLLVTSPVWLVLAFYAWTDPFGVVHHYDSYYQPHDSSLVVSRNVDFVSTETFIRNYPRYHYDSYIFGGSRSGFFQVAYWQQFLLQGASTFHFNASEESLLGVAGKVAYIDKLHAPLRNALFVMDHQLLAGITNPSASLTIKHPAISGDSWLSFHLAFVKAFFDRRFIVSWCDYKITGRTKPYMLKQGALRRSYIIYDDRHNEMTMQSLADSLNKDTARYYKVRARFFTRRPEKERIGRPVIGAKQEAMLQDIAAVLQQNKTSFRIVINPLYDQVKLAPQDLAVLYRIFGKENVYDFSGKNDITESKYNYYEYSHYLPSVANRIMDSIYTKR